MQDCSVKSIRNANLTNRPCHKTVLEPRLSNRWKGSDKLSGGKETCNSQVYPGRAQRYYLRFSTTTMPQSKTFTYHIYPSIYLSSLLVYTGPYPFVLSLANKVIFCWLKTKIRNRVCVKYPCNHPLVSPNISRI